MNTKMLKRIGCKTFLICGKYYILPTSIKGIFKLIKHTMERRAFLRDCRKDKHDWEFCKNTLPENSYRCRKCGEIKVFDSVNQKNAPNPTYEMSSTKHEIEFPRYKK